MNGSVHSNESESVSSPDDLIEYDPGDLEESVPENEIDENEVKTIYIEFIKNYQSSRNELVLTQDTFPASINTKDNESISCNVKYCKCISTLNTELAFFSVPQNVWSSKQLLGKWTDALQCEGESLPISFKICEKHFKPEQIELKKKGKCLKRFAVPCLDLPSKEDMIVPYFSDVDSLEQFIKGSAESYLDMKSRSISDDSMESISTVHCNPISVQMEVIENQKTVVKPVAISCSNSVKMFTTPLRRVTKQRNSVEDSIFDDTILNDTVVITKLKRKKSMDRSFFDQTVQCNLDETSSDQIINSRTAKRHKSICSTRNTNSKEVSVVQKVRPMQHKVNPIIHNELIAANKNAHLSYLFKEQSPESRTSRRSMSVHYQNNTSPKRSIPAHQIYEKSSPLKRQRNEKVQIKLSGPVTFQLLDPPQISEPNQFVSSIRTEKQLRDMCGLQTFDILDLLESFYRDVEDIPNIKAHIILTFIKLKTNISFTFLSTVFGYDEYQTQKIFNQTIKNFANLFDDIDFDFPKKPSDGNFQQFKFAVECLELRADNENIKVYLKILPNGIVKYLGKMISSRLSSRFKLSDLEDFDEGDCIWLGRGVSLDDNDLKSRGVNVVLRKKYVPSILKILTKFHSLKILDGTISLGLLPHIKNIMTTICGVCNLTDRC